MGRVGLRPDARVIIQSSISSQPDSHIMIGRTLKSSPRSPAPGTSEKLVRVGCPAHNCGGRSPARGARAGRGSSRGWMPTTRTGDDLSAPQLRACVRVALLPASPVSSGSPAIPHENGWGRAARASSPASPGMRPWTPVAAHIRRVKETYGNSALFVPYGTGSHSQINGSQTARRLLNLYGGCLGYYNTYSSAATTTATPYVFGTVVTGNQRQDWMNSKYILLWGWNPAEMRDGNEQRLFHQAGAQARRQGGLRRPRGTASAQRAWQTSGFRSVRAPMRRC